MMPNSISLSSVDIFGSSKPSDFPFLGLLLDLLLHISLVTLLSSSQSVGEAPRPSNAAPTHLRSQLFVRGWLMTPNLSLRNIPLIWPSWSIGLLKMSLHHNAWWSYNHKGHHDYCTHDKSKGELLVFLMIYVLLTSYSWLNCLCIFCLRIVMCSSLSDLIWVCIMPNRWNISCRRPPLFSAQHSLLSANL